MELEKELGLNIQSYEDLLDPALKGRIVLSDPNSSSAAWNNMCNIFAVYGYDTQEAWDYLRALLENGLVISTSSSVCFKSVEGWLHQYPHAVPHQWRVGHVHGLRHDRRLPPSRSGKGHD